MSPRLPDEHSRRGNSARFGLSRGTGAKGYIRTLGPILALVFSASYAAAQHVDMDAGDAAKVLGQAERAPGLESERDALKLEVAALKDQVARLEKLAALDEQLLARQTRLTDLADAERDAWKGRAEQIAKDGRKAGFWNRVKERAAEGALIGSLAGTAVPGIGNVAGALGGAVLGGVVGALESAIAP